MKSQGKASTVEIPIQALRAALSWYGKRVPIQKLNETANVVLTRYQITLNQTQNTDSYQEGILWS